MPLSLHAAFAPSALQMLGTAQHLLDKTESWCADRDCDHSAILEAQLIEDMQPFCYQIKSVAEHTAGAIEGVRAGVYGPDLNPPPTTFEDLRDKLTGATQALGALSEDEMESWIGKPMRFEFKAMRMDFVVEEFLLSFSQPNFYFHATTFYDILRMKGVPLGKRDFMGQLRVKG